MGCSDLIDDKKRDILRLPPLPAENFENSDTPQYWINDHANAQVLDTDNTSAPIITQIGATSE
jgi:hypothetical protein